MARKTTSIPLTPSSRRKHREAWVGLFVIVGVTVGLFLLFTLTDASMFRGRYTVSTVVPDASGIRKGDAVLLHGVHIGRVKGFDIDAKGVEISLEIEGEYEIPVGSHVALRRNALLGGVVADVVPSDSPRFVHDGGTLPGESAEQILQNVGKLEKNAASVLTRAGDILAPKTVQDIQGSAQELDQLLAEVRGVAVDLKGDLHALTRSLRNSAVDVDKLTTKPELERALGRLDSLTARLDQASYTLSRASSSLETVLGRMKRGEGTLGRLSKDATLYDNLNRAAINLNRLARDFREHPHRYLHLKVF